MDKTEIMTLIRFSNAKFPSCLKNEEYHFEYDNTLLSGIIKSFLHNNLNLNYDFNTFLADAYLNAAKKALKKNNKSIELAEYFQAYNNAVMVLQKVKNY